MQEYTVGFLFNSTLRYVSLIEKEKEPWTGKLNGVGGKIEKDEKPIDGMKREFFEEADVWIDDWKFIATLEGKDFKVYFYAAIDDKLFYVKTKTNERVYIKEVNEIDHNLNCVSNVPWLVQLSLSRLTNKEKYGPFTILEKTDDE